MDSEAINKLAFRYYQLKMYHIFATYTHTHTHFLFFSPIVRTFADIL